MDRRDRSFPRPAFDSKANTVTLEIYNVEGDESEEVDFPARMEVCGTCQGHGSHVNPDIDRNGISGEDFDADPDFAEGYRSGRYDVECVECAGLRVVPSVNVEACSPALKAQFERWEEAQYDRAREEAADRHTRMMEDGIWEQ